MKSSNIAMKSPNKRRKQSSNTESNTEAMNIQTSEWTQVGKKRRTEANTLIIAANRDASYADILRKIKSDINLKNLGENVREKRLQKHTKKDPDKADEHFIQK